MRIKFILIISLCCFFMTSCEKIIGNYAYVTEVDTIKIFSNGTYKRVLSVNGDSLISTGRWKEDGKDIFFYDWNENGKLIIRGMKEDKNIFTKEVRLYTDYDNDLFYKKIK